MCLVPKHVCIYTLKVCIYRRASASFPSFFWPNTDHHLRQIWHLLSTPSILPFFQSFALFLPTRLVCFFFFFPFFWATAVRCMRSFPRRDDSTNEQHSDHDAKVGTPNIYTHTHTHIPSLSPPVSPPNLGCARQAPVPALRSLHLACSQLHLQFSSFFFFFLLFFFLSFFFSLVAFLFF